MTQAPSVLQVVLSPILALGLALPALAQRGRVFTNEDFPAASAPAAPASSPDQSPASRPAASAEPNSETPAGDTDQLIPSFSPKELVEQLAASQAALRFILNQFNQKEAEETDATARARWHSIAQSMLLVLQGHQQLLTEAQEQLKQQGSAPAVPAQ
jgi:hypothetical protein